jgi:phenylacetate-CoA ligase
MPLIRYEIGDFAEVGDPCPCGRGLPVLRRILGRQQNMLLMPSGEARWPLLSSTDIRGLLALASVRQYQFVQKSLDRLELRLANVKSLSASDEDRLRDWVRDKFGYPFQVDFTYFDELPSGKSGKHQDFLCEVAQ